MDAAEKLGHQCAMRGLLGALQNHHVASADSLGPATEVCGWLLPFLEVSGLWVSKGIHSLGSLGCGELRRAEND